MASFFSPVKEINDFHMNELPLRRIIRGCTVLRVGRTVLIQTEKSGTFFYGGMANGAYTSTDFTWVQGILKGLARLGIFKNYQVDEHMEHVTKLSKLDDAKWSAEQFEKSSQLLGLKLTAEQKKIIAKAKARK